MSFRPRSFAAVIVISISSLFACATSASVIDVQHETSATTLPPDFPRIESPRYDSFEKALLAPPRFPLELVAEPVKAGEPMAMLGAPSCPGRALVTPGRSSAVRQSVPPRSRRNVRVWERDAV